MLAAAELASEFRKVFRELINDNFTYVLASFICLLALVCSFIFSWFCGVIVTFKSAIVQGSHFATCESKFAVFNCCYSVERKSADNECRQRETKQQDQ